MIQHLGEIVTGDEKQNISNGMVRQELQELSQWLLEEGDNIVSSCYNWSELAQYAEQRWRVETQEVINTLLIELYPELVDELEELMAVDEDQHLVPQMSLQELILRMFCISYCPWGSDIV